MFAKLMAIFIVVYSCCSLADEKIYELWNDEGSALAFCKLESESKCYVSFGGFEVNVSQVENLNIFKLGLAQKNKYEKVITLPVKWLKSSDGELMVLFKTQVWMMGKRYTVTEPVLIRNGKYVVR